MDSLYISRNFADAIIVAISSAVAGILESSVSSVRESEIERAFIPCSDSNGDMPVIELGV